jgi:UrcA family protein
MSRSFDTLVLAIALAVVTQPTLADQNEVLTRQITVSYADLNLQSEAGARALLRRLHTAATRACRRSPDNLAYWQQPAISSSCRAEALRIAVATIDRPTVTAAYHDYTKALPGLASR